MPPRVLLIGLPGTGKSSVGRRVAERLGVEFADSDSMIEVRAGRSIPRIFAEDGEPAFRQLEASVVADALTKFSGVLALGGGAVLTESTKQAIAASGIPVVLLHTQLATLANRVGTGAGRPLLADDPGHRLAELAAVREPVYRPGGPGRRHGATKHGPGRRGHRPLARRSRPGERSPGQ